MDAKTCLQKLQYVGVLAFATADADGSPQVRNISAIHYEPDGFIFLRPEARISAGTCWQTAVSRFSGIQNIKR